MHAARFVTTWALLVGVAAVFLAGCSSPPAEISVTVVAEGAEHSVALADGTVRDALAAAGVTVGGLDRVQPDLWEELRPALRIRVVRVQEVEEVQRRTVPFEKRVLRSEALPEGESRLVQLGQEGEEEITYRVILEDGVEVSRTLIQRRVVRPPVHEVLAVGIRGNLPSVPISGTIAYISGGNAWVMRAESGGRRPLTAAGDLDGRVFDLSPDGRWLLYSRMITDTDSPHLNELWLVNTVVVGQEPWPLDVESVSYAGWDGEGDRFAYSTAERTGGSPGWKAHNDLWIAEVRLPLTHEGDMVGPPVITDTEVLSAAPGGVYPWWGTSFAWSPDGSHMAYATANAMGVIELESREVRELIYFPEYHTHAEWVWTPRPSWSPDGRYLACTVHVARPGDEVAQESPRFDLYAVRLDGEVQVPLAEAAGMWASPQWARVPGGGPWALAFAQSRDRTYSQDSQYDLFVMDRDGSDRVHLFPPPDEPGLVAPQFAWSPYDGGQLVVVWQGNLYLVDVATKQVLQLTADGNSGQPRWGR